jgi:hypothetical protein
MIRVVGEKDNGSGVYIEINLGYPLDDMKLHFYRAGTSSLEAVLLRREIDKQLGAHMEQISRTYYKMGWREKASRKCSKRTFFSSNTVLLDWELKAAGR